MKKNLAILWSMFAGATFISQSLMDMCSILLGLYLVYCYFKTRKTPEKFKLLPKMGFDWLWIIWVLVIAMGFVLNPRDPQFMFLHVIDFKWILLLYALVSTLNLIDVDLKFLGWVLPLTFLLTLFAVGDYLAVFFVTHDFDWRLGGIFDFSIIYAHSYGLLFCFLFGLFLKVYPVLAPRKKYFYLITLFVLGLSVVLTYTRGIWIAMFVSLVVTGFILKPKVGMKFLAVMVLLGAAMYVGVPTFKKRVDFSFNPSRTYDQERIALWRANFEMSKDYPFFGVGYGANKLMLPIYFKKLGYPDTQFMSHAHNQYIHFLAGTGYVGLMIYLLVLGFIFTWTYRAYRKLQSNHFLGGLALGSLAAQICFIIGGLTESNFESAKVRFAIMFFWAIGIYLYLQIFSKTEKTLLKDSP